MSDADVKVFFPVDEVWKNMIAFYGDPSDTVSEIETLIAEYEKEFHPLIKVPGFDVDKAEAEANERIAVAAKSMAYVPLSPRRRGVVTPNG